MQRRVPSYRLHRSSGRAVVTIAGRDHYLGPHDSPESRKAYDALVLRWIAGGRRPLRDSSGAGPTAAEFADLARSHVRGYYRRNGNLSSAGRFALRTLATFESMFDQLPIAEFGRVEWRLFRDYYLRTPTVRGGPFARGTVNAHAECLRRLIRWGCDEGIIPAAVWAEVSVPRRLARGRTTAPDNPPVRPATADAVAAVLGGVRGTVRAMVEVQYLTGMRPGEVCGMRPAAIDATGQIWHYTVPAEVNKMAHKGKARVVALGPRAQAILRPFLDRAPSPTAPLFRTRRGAEFKAGSYYKVIAKACDRLGIERLRPNQLRHAAATLIRARFGLESSQAVLGHSAIQTTQRYAEVDMTRADVVAAEMG